MLVDLALNNAKIYTAGGLIRAGLAIDKGKIFKIAKETNLPKSSAKLNLKGNIVLPGLVDSHVHLRDQLFAYKEDFFSGTAASAAGGVTSVVDMPNNNPVTMDSRSLRKRMSLAKTRILVNVAFCSALPENVTEMRSTLEEGVVAFKLYLSEKVGRLDIDDDESLRQAFGEAAKLKIPIAVHAEDKEVLKQNERKMREAGKSDVESYIRVHSPKAEEKAINRVARFAGESGAAIHLCHISSAPGLQALAAAKDAGLPVTGEVTPHHLLLSSTDLKRLETLALTNPPLRSQRHTSALWKGVRTGLVDTIASDHAPHTVEEKRTGSVWDAKPGIPGLETTLPLLLTQVNERHLTLKELLKFFLETPATIFCLKDRGRLEENCWADLVVVDMKQERKIDSSNFFSRAKYSPFDGCRIKGQPLKTFVNGSLVYDEGEIVAKPGTGAIIRCVR